MKNTKNIDALNFLDFVQLTEAAKEEGYVFDFTTNLTAPQNLGFRYFAVMVRGSKNVYPEPAKKQEKAKEPAQEEKVQVEVETPEVEQDKKEQTQRGRKPNSAK